MAERASVELYSGEQPENLHRLSYKIGEKTIAFSLAELKSPGPQDLSMEILESLEKACGVTQSGDRLADSRGLRVHQGETGGIRFFVSAGERQPGLYQAFWLASLKTDGTLAFPRLATPAPNYSILKLIADPKIQGAWPQLTDFTTPRPMDRVYTRHHRGPLPDSLVLSEFQLDPKTQVTDFVSSVFLKPNGFFVRPRMREILSDYAVTDYQFYESKAMLKESTISLLFLQLKDTESIDYGSSRFRVTGGGQQATPDSTQLDTLDALYLRKKELVGRPGRPTLKPAVLKLTSYPDLLKIPLTLDFLISTRLAMRFHEMNVSGVETVGLENYTIF